MYNIYYIPATPNTPKMAKKSTLPMSIFKSKTSVAPKEVRIVIEPKRLQEQYAKSHESTGKEVLLFVIVVAILICGFFAAHKIF